MHNKNIYNLNLKVDSIAWDIGEAFLKGILLEVSSYPKPGLVSSISMGSHKDMNILTFMVSSAAITPAFFLCAQAGRDHKGEITDLLPVIRKIGVCFEKKLLESTKGINTQRGILFAAGILCGVAGYLSQRTRQLKSDELFATASKMTRGLISRELVNLDIDKDSFTAGEQLYIKYGATGIRGEVEAGFPSVRDIGLPALKVALAKGVKLNHCLVHTLISLMTCVEDTNILWRKNKEELTNVQNQAKYILAKGSIFTRKGLEEIYLLDKRFVEKNISPGGSADLVAITVGSYLLEKKQFPVTVL